MELNNIKPSEIVFNGKLFASDYSVIFLAMVHDQGHDGTTNRKIVSWIFHVLESAAYRRLRGSRVVWTWNYPSFPWDDGEKRMDNFLKGIQEIHGAGVRHRDPKPRNMMIVKGDSERVVWIDFDRAETYNLPVTDEQKRLLDEEEEEIVRGFWDCFTKADCTKGKPDEAYLFYCT
ncbi:hypothetical protein PABG_00580 [Paracoccidioides brasiliensis Pb03]|nr:hypothetical protein PABG_00580 [Paracoccidioides brasiliensis Pb03]